MAERYVGESTESKPEHSTLFLHGATKQPSVHQCPTEIEIVEWHFVIYAPSLIIVSAHDSFVAKDCDDQEKKRRAQ